jgi:hypothetical protein
MKPRNLPATVTTSIGLLLVFIGIARFLFSPVTVELLVEAQPRSERMIALVGVITMLDQISGGVLLLCIGLTLLYAASGLREQQHWASIVSLINVCLAGLGIFLLVGGGILMVVTFQILQGEAVNHQEKLPLMVILFPSLLLGLIMMALLLASASAYRHTRGGDVTRSLKLILDGLQARDDQSGDRENSPPKHLRSD